MNFKEPRILLFSALVAIFFVLVNISALYPVELPYYIFRPAFLVLMIVMHLSLVKKASFCFLGCQFLLGVGLFLQYYNSKDLMNTAMLFYIASLLFFIFVVLKMIKKVNYKAVFNYLLLFLLPFFTIYFIVLDDKIDSFLSFTYGLLVMCLLALIFYNYLKKPNQENKLLLIGFLIGITSIAIISMNVYGLSSDSSRLFIVNFFSITCDLIISIALILKQRRLHQTSL